MGAKISVENLSVIFGESPEEEAIPMVEQGYSKEEIQEKTGHIVGVANASFSIEEGEIFVVMGLSGSGKSTLIRCINRLIEPTTGKVFVDGEDIMEMDKERLRELRRTKLSMVFQHFNLFPHKTLLENVAYGLKVRGEDKEERQQEAMDKLDLVGLKPWADYYPSSLSGGMQQRVGLARALATDADILLMDEPFGALDPLIRREMQDELLELQNSLHKTMFFITHDLNEALRVGDKVSIMKEGKIIQIGTPVDIITNPADEYVASFVQEVDQSRVLTAEIAMNPAEIISKEQDNVQTALNRFQEREDLDVLFVVNSNQKFEGVVFRQDIIRASRKGEENFMPYLNRDMPRTEPSSSLFELYTSSADAHSVAVVDKTGHLHGVLDTQDLVASMAEVERKRQEVVGESGGDGNGNGNGNGTT